MKGIRQIKHLCYFIFFVSLLLNANEVLAQQKINLIVRADDMGMTHAANLSCMDAFHSGVARSVEVMVPTPWYTEAVKMLNAEPGYDVGIHLVLTSEWTNLKWRPLTHAASLTDSNGYFFPTIWKGTPDNPSLHDHQPDFNEAEKELRAQIEMAKKHIKSLSHISTHMAFDQSHPQLKSIVQKLSQEYQLPLQSDKTERFPNDEKMKSDTVEKRQNAFIHQLATLKSGKTYLLVTHPCISSDEMESLETPAYQNVRADRNADYYMITDKRLKSVLLKHNIRLVSVKESLLQY